MFLAGLGAVEEIAEVFEVGAGLGKGGVRGGVHPDEIGFINGAGFQEFIGFLAGECEAIGGAVLGTHGGRAVDDKKGGLFPGEDFFISGEEGLQEGGEEGKGGEGAQKEEEPVLRFADAGGFFEDALEELGTRKFVLGRSASREKVHQNRGWLREGEPGPGWVGEKEVHEGQARRSKSLNQLSVVRATE